MGRLEGCASTLVVGEVAGVGRVRVRPFAVSLARRKASELVFKGADLDLVALGSEAQTVHGEVARSSSVRVPLSLLQTADGVPGVPLDDAELGHVLAERDGGGVQAFVHGSFDGEAAYFAMQPLRIANAATAQEGATPRGAA